MQRFTQELSESDLSGPDIICPDYIDWKNSVCFDIETTGLSPASSFLYLIGCVYQDNGRFYLIQWLSDDILKEEELLLDFTEWLSRFRCLIHYNGTAFDIPYLAAKCKKYGIACNFDSFGSIDIYKRILPYRRYFPTQNLRQRTMEEFLRIKREDVFSGQDLIPVYTAYLGRARYETYHNGEQAGDYACLSSDQVLAALQTNGRLPDIPAATLLSFLLGHNREDAANLPALLALLSYTDGFGCRFACEGAQEERNAVVIRLRTACPVPVPLTAEFQAFTKSENACHCTFSLSGDCAVLRIPVFEGEVRHYYENYKDYYYLTEEGIVSHKSVAAYVSTQYRRKAKPEECFYKKSGRFLPQAAAYDTPYYLRAYKQKISYFEITEEFLSSPEKLTRYACHILSYL